MRHSKPATSVSGDENENAAFDDATVPLVPMSMRVFGGAGGVTVQLRWTGVASTLPAPSRARTRRVWEPTASPSKTRSAGQACQSAGASREHSNVAVGSSLENANAAVVDSVEAGG